MASQYSGNTLEDLFNCPCFYGEISRENATEVLNNGIGRGRLQEPDEVRTILFLETVSDDIGQNRFAMIAGFRRNLYCDIEPIIIFVEFLNLHDRIYFTNFAGIERTNQFSLEVLAAVKVASLGFNLETLGLPRMIKEEVRKYQDLSDSIKSYYANLNVP